MEKTRCYLGLGANLGDPLAQLDRAVELLAAQAAGETRVSSVTRSAPWDGTDQPDYLNLVCEADFEASPREILEIALGIERELGRPATRAKWSARVIDIDLLVIPGRIVREDDLRVPHPLYRERMFALQPLAEIAPSLIDPETGQTAAAMLRNLTAREPLLPIARRQEALKP